MTQSAETEETDKVSCPDNSSSIIPEAKSSQTGVSVDYVPHPDKQWFVMRASYGRERKASDFIVDDGTFTYLPTHTIIKEHEGKRKHEEEVLVPNILFVYTTPEKAEGYTKDTPELSFLTYYYDHFKKAEDGKNPPLVVPQKEMTNFVKATSTGNSHVRLVDPENCHYKSGDWVKVTMGPFEGVEGRVARIAGQQRVVVSIKGVCTVATAYVPTAFLETTKEPNTY
jgi:transcription antitermination factor NusG